MPNLVTTLNAMDGSMISAGFCFQDPDALDIGGTNSFPVHTGHTYRISWFQSCPDGMSVGLPGIGSPQTGSGHFHEDYVPNACGTYAPMFRAFGTGGIGAIWGITAEEVTA